MANIETTDIWSPAVYQWADGDVLDGGPESLEVLPVKQMANRSIYQRLRSVTPWSDVLAAAYGYPQGACVMHSNVSWRAKIANAVEPGTDATKWERWGFSESELAAAMGGASANVQAVINNTYIGPTPQKLRAFTPGVVLSDMPVMNTNYVFQSLALTGARRARIFAHASLRNQNAGAVCDVGCSLNVDGVNAFGGHYLGAGLPPTISPSSTQIPLSIMDTIFDLDPTEIYTITLIGNKGSSVGPIVVQDAYIDVEYV